MKHLNNRALLLLLALFVLAACSQQQARKPVSHSEGSFMKESVIRNKKMVAGEESKIDSIMKSDSARVYLPSKKGYWYTYLERNTKDTLRPRKGDIAYFEYEVQDLDGHVIYSKLELRPQEYYVDQEQEIMMGLRHGIKLMRKKETVKFLFPSHMGYGYHGDKRRIGHNEPLICIVTLHDFRPENLTTPE